MEFFFQRGNLLWDLVRPVLEFTVILPGTLLSFP